MRVSYKKYPQSVKRFGEGWACDVELLKFYFQGIGSADPLCESDAKKKCKYTMKPRHILEMEPAGTSAFYSVDVPFVFNKPASFVNGPHRIFQSSGHTLKGSKCSRVNGKYLFENELPRTKREFSIVICIF